MRPTTLITDFDNTLYDWFDMWHQSFDAMLNKIELISGINRATLIPSIRALHQKYHTSEYAYLIEDLECLKDKYPNRNLLLVFEEAINAYQHARKLSLRLYDGVKETLSALRSQGVLIVIYTDSLGIYTNYRVRALELDGLIDFVYSPPDHGKRGPQESEPESPIYVETTQLTYTRHLYVPPKMTKPNPKVLLDIIKEIGRKPDECVYLGDSLMKDVAMAQDAGIVDVLAEYGSVQHKDGYDLLRQVSHWTDEDVKREQTISKRTTIPTHSISHFNEIMRFFDIKRTDT